MSAVTGIVAGLVTAAGAVTLYRYAQRRAAELRERLEKSRTRSARPDAAVIEFERDPATGVFHAK